MSPKMSSYSELLSIAESYSQVGREEIDKQELKSFTKDICKAYKAGHLPDNIFHQLMETLLAFFIERSFEEKFSSKMTHLDDKLFRMTSTTKWL